MSQEITYEFNERTGELKLDVPFVPVELLVTLSGAAYSGVPTRPPRKRISSMKASKPPARADIGVPIKPPKRIEVRIVES